MFDSVVSYSVFGNWFAFLLLPNLDSNRSRRDSNGENPHKQASSLAKNEDSLERLETVSGSTATTFKKVRLSWG